MSIYCWQKEVYCLVRSKKIIAFSGNMNKSISVKENPTNALKGQMVRVHVAESSESLTLLLRFSFCLFPKCLKQQRQL